MRDELLELRVGGRGQVLDGLQDDHGLAVGEHGRHGERDDAGHEDGEDLGQLGVLGHASPGGHDIDLHVSGAHSFCTCAMNGGDGEPKRGRGVSGGERGRRMVNGPCVPEGQRRTERSDAPRRRSDARRPISLMNPHRLLSSFCHVDDSKGRTGFHVRKFSQFPSTGATARRGKSWELSRSMRVRNTVASSRPCLKRTWRGG